MRTKVTLVLLLLNVVLFFFIFHFEGDWRTERAALEVRRRVLGAEAADIRALTVTGPEGSFSLERRGDAWFLTQPLEWPANPHAVERIISDLQLLEQSASFSVADLDKNSQSLADYGLDQPRRTVTFTSGGPDTTGTTPVTTTLRLGDITKVGDRLYILSPDGKRIDVVGRELADGLSLRTDQIRTDTLLTIQFFEASSLNLQIAAPAGVRVRIRRAGDRWLFETPILARASGDDTERAINGLDALRVKSFVAPGPAAPSPATAPSLRVTIEGDNRRETLLLGRPVDASAPPDGDRDYYGQLDGRSAQFVVTIKRSLMDTLENAQEKLRDKHLLDFDADTVTAMTLSAPNLPDLTLERDVAAATTGKEPAPADGSAGWQIVLPGGPGQAPQTRPADREAVQRLLSQLTQLTAERFQSDAARAADLENWGFNRPERQISLSFEAPVSGVQPAAPAVPLVLQLGLAARPDNQAYARLAGAPLSVYAVDPEILHETPVAPRSWRDRLLRDLPTGASITGLTLTDLSTGAAILKWTSAANSAPSEAVDTVLAQLRTLRALSFEADGFTEKVKVDGEDRPWKYRLDAAISLPGGEGREQTSVSSLWLSERLGGSLQLAGSQEAGAVFAIDQPFVDALWTLTHASRPAGP
jgi:hypothetical protein